MIEISDFQKIGVGLAGFGVGFLGLGILMFFDKGLLAIGNILLLSGLAFIIGLQRTFWFFCQRHKLKASTSFFTGILTVLMGWPFIGILIETYGFILLFGGFLPTIVGFIRRVPVLGLVLNLPLINKIAERIAGESYRSMV